MVFKRSGKNIPVSHFEWFWIACVKKAGYYANARKAASFYSDLDKKINGAFQSGLLKKRDVLIASGPYSVGSDDLKTLIRILPRNYFWLLQTPGSFAYNFNSFTVKQVHPANNAVLLAEWQNSLHVKYLHPIEKQKIIQENNSFMNKFWNFCVTFYAFIIIPLMHLTTPFALIVLIVGLFRKEWYSILLLVFVSSYIAHFLLLSVIDVSVGYQATSIAYFLPSYSTIIITTFISVSILISFFRKNQQPK